MTRFTAVLKKFADAGDKTGWTYLEIPAAIAAKIKPGMKQSFRVKGYLDKHPIQQTALLPHGEGSFILPVNAGMRKGIGKKQGASVQVELEEDTQSFVMNVDFIDCLADLPAAQEFFESLAPSHRRYFSKWIDDAKTEETRAKRIAASLNALERRMGYGEMIRSLKADRGS
ncbi:YdeI/OmpD-associated family protein [Chitinophaga sp.]|uniref:YdeI/OmpD-associated family protein n=1 Tax=Chitinophaga sp. TaxID=1869181 RepID=UPI00262FD286|nr:YdeI/OmpD-associated family protein [uncultured Chitinophaga sp.]